MSTRLGEGVRLRCVRLALYDIRDAQEHLRLAGAIRAHAAVCRARKSIEGALRHAARLDVMGDEDLAAMKRQRRAPKRRTVPEPKYITPRERARLVRLAERADERS